MRFSLGTAVLVLWSAALAVAAAAKVAQGPAACGDQLDDQGRCGQMASVVPGAQVSPHVRSEPRLAGLRTGSLGPKKAAGKAADVVEGNVVEVAAWRGGGVLLWVALAGDSHGEAPVCVVLGRRLLPELPRIPDVGWDVRVEGAWRKHKRVTCLHPEATQQLVSSDFQSGERR